MATGTGKHKLLSIGPTEPWSIREKLCLASSVMRSGDQNWVSVSRAIKPFAEAGRPPDWFSQKHCASQYSELLETTETPKRKRGERGEVVETVEDVIVRKLTAERIEELKKLIKETQEKYRKLKKESELIQSGHMDSKLEELWNDIVAKKKQEEEEAEIKKKATDAAYQARQAAKNIPRRTSSTIGRSSVGSSSPSGEFGLGDLTPNSTEEGNMGVSVGSLPNTPISSFTGIPDTPPPAPLESPLTPVMDDSPQKKMVGQKATPPPSPLLSELLKKGSLLPTSPRLVSESEMALGSNSITGSGVLMDVGVLPGLHGGELHPIAGTIPASPAASGAPTLSRLLEAGPAHFAAPLASFSAATSESPSKSLLTPIESQATIIMMSALPMTAAVPVTQQEDNESTSDPHTVTVSMDSSDISMIIDSINKECLGNGDSSTQSKDESSDSKGDLDLAEKMDIAVSYTGEELDFETVGDIIAIIEDKVDDHPEVLDVAAVEAALSFCEENDDPQALGGPWDQAVQEHTVKQETLPKSLIPGPKDTDTIMNIMELTDIKAEPSEPEVEPPAQSDGNSVTSHSSFQFDALDEELDEASVKESVKEEDTTEHQVKTEESQCENSQTGAFSNEEERGIPSEESTSLTDPIKSEPPAASQSKGICANNFIQDSQGEEEEEEEDVTSEVGSPEETKEEEAGEEYLSEMDNEPPISESDDGFSIHNAQLQSHTLADSIPSSPASSQFSVCSEDQEAIQAQKIWKKAIMLVWRAAANHRYANVFLQPVTDDIAPGYHSIVQRPMDLSTIKKNIETGLIRSTAEFQRDIMLMFQNAVMYNSSDHDVYHMAVEMQRDVLEQIQQFLATQLIMQTSESGISAKSLRGRDSTRKQDASEKDSVPMGSPAFLLSLFMGSHLQQNIHKDQTFCHDDICPVSSSQDESDFKDVEKEKVIQGDVSELEIQVESLSLEFEGIVIRSDGDNSDDESSLQGISQVSELMLSQSTTSVDDLLSCPENSCMENSSEGDGRFLGSNLENNAELVLTENLDKIQSFDTVHATNDLILGCPQVEDPRICPSTANIDDVLICPENSCMNDWSEEDDRFLGNNLENNVECQSQPNLPKTEHNSTDTIQSSDIELVFNESVDCCTQELNVEETVMQSTDGKPLSQMDPHPMNQSKNDICICESAICITTKSSSLLELLLLNTKDSHLKNIRKQLAPIWKMIADHRYAALFRKPLKEKEAPGYKEVVKRPMDLSTIKKGLSKGRIKTSAEFQRDVLLMLQNAVMYNSICHSVHQKTLEMQKDVVEWLQVFNEQATQSGTE
ncbi:bromodomain-containing protein 8 isoform X2 [Hyla sarda]|uniref:bromodomain-containing protein 8 isoform X2 n=1 Tax=Hyla sarda TaxID=327740 RepID=UPI0024C3E4CC|nr:bromodomain-containing protein 8 isoform X2 [Hyla sarda]